MQALYRWLDIVRKEGRPVLGKTLTANDWAAEAKFEALIETAPLSEAEISQYCREKGLYREQVQQWKLEFLPGFQTSEVQAKTINRPRLTKPKSNHCNGNCAIRRKRRRKLPHYWC